MLPLDSKAEVSQNIKYLNRWPSGRRYLFTSRAVPKDLGSNLGPTKLYVSGLKEVGLKQNSAAPKT